MPPSAFVRIREGTPVVITSRYESSVEVGSTNQTAYRGWGNAWVTFAETTTLSDGIDATRGARGQLLGLDSVGDGAGERLGADVALVQASDFEIYEVACRRLSSYPLPLATAPTPKSPRWIDDTMSIRDAGGEDIYELDQEDVLDLVATNGAESVVRVWWQGYEFTGRVPTDALLLAPPEYGGLIGDQPGLMTGGFGAEDPTMSTSPGSPCEGTALLKAGSTMSTGPAIDPSRSSVAMAPRELPSLDRAVEVELEASLAEERRVVVPNPAPDIVSITVWVAADALDRTTCPADDGAR